MGSYTIPIWADKHMTVSDKVVYQRWMRKADIHYQIGNYAESDRWNRSAVDLCRRAVKKSKKEA